jgi:Fur family peroxide stress response transcriptional regulator
MHKKHVAKLLSEAGIKSTPIRENLLLVLYSSKTPKSADTLHDELETLGITSHRATLYRDLKIFQETKIVKQVTILGEHAELFVINKEHTHHFKCMECGQISSFSTESIDEGIGDFIKRLSQQHSWLIKSHALKFYGLCKRCNTNHEK